MTPATAPPIAIVIDRVPLDVDVAPLDVDGSLLVPARAIFTALGASVEYDAANGRIVATRGARVITLHLGHRGASVDGRAVVLAATPRVVDARTLVPLRFVTEAFGGVATFEAARATVVITGAAAPPIARDPQTVGTPEAYAGITLVARHPEPGELVTSALPAISGAFETHGGPALDDDSVRVAIDGVDETAAVQRSGTHFGFTPTRPLAPGDHEIDVNGLDRSATPFDIHWAFGVAQNAAYEPGADASAVQNDAAVPDTIEYDASVVPGAFSLAQPYMPGSGGVVRFVYGGPPGGTGYVSLCGYGPTYPMRYDPTTNYYLATVPLPPGLYAPACYVTGTFVSSGGVATTLPLAAPIPIDTTTSPALVVPRVRAAPFEPRSARESPVRGPAQRAPGAYPAAAASPVPASSVAPAVAPNRRLFAPAPAPVVAPAAPSPIFMRRGPVFVPAPSAPPPPRRTPARAPSH